MTKVKRRQILAAVLIAAAIFGCLALLTARDPVEAPSVTETAAPSVEDWETAPTLPQSAYSPEDFDRSEEFLTCSGVALSIGIDVSKHQEDIDWQAVAEAGVEFVIVRLGYRGYLEGALNADSMAAAHLTGARAAGLQVGAYFYSQATTVQEALEEAAFALELLGDLSLDLPLAFDWEITERTEAVDKAAATACAAAFCEAVEQAGQEAMIYFNTYQAQQRLELTALTDYAWWLAMYSDGETFPCRFDYWQYTETGSVPGITGAVDINIRLPE